MKFFFILTFLCLGLVALGQDIRGRWYAYTDVKTMRLRFEYDLREEGGRLAAGLKLPDLTARNYDVEQVEWKDGVLSMASSEAATSCSLRWQEDGSLKGTVVWEGFEFPFHLTRTPVVFRRPQTPQPPFGYVSEEVSFPSEEDGVVLSGTLTRPAGEGKHRAVVLVSGSGTQDRDNTFSGHRTFLVIADYFARNGIATLRVDDRGCGKSGGKAAESSLPDAVGDALSAIHFLQTRPEIDAGSVGVAGHSEGGFAALTLAAWKEAAFIITLAGGGTNGRELLLQQRAALLRQSGSTEEAIAEYNGYMRQAQDIVLQTGDAQTCETRLMQLFAGTPLDGQAAAVTKQLFNPAKIELLKYDPEWDFPEITCPVLALNGDKDCQVPPCNLEAIRKGITANGNTRVKTVLLPGLNHMFQTAVTGLPVEYSDIEETISPAALEAMLSWLKAL